ncbi:cadmium-translocating P-type ATPase [Candidatus Dojkabacteria bacterium]|nr:cadmium-translocating P-type ATPase [Candidatus Dojkabacteria bacterium]
MNKLKTIITNFYIPSIVMTGIVAYLLLVYVFQLELFGLIIISVVIFIGSLTLIRDTIVSLMHKGFALDYIAIFAIIVGIIAQEYLVAAIIVLMLSGGTALEKYGMLMAKKSLSALIDRIPNQVTLWQKDGKGKKIEIEKVKVGDKIVIRKGEVVPLDGNLVTENAQIDESSLTGEPYLQDKISNDLIRSGTVNIGDVIVIEVIRPDTESTYRKIVDMVKDAQKEKAPLIRLADKYSAAFTVITMLIATFAYFYTQDLVKVLAVLVIATPCPLILATPIALMGGMSKAAKHKIIIKNLGSLEVLSRVQTIIFDKTGTITLGRPDITKLEVLDTKYTEQEIYGIAEAIERNSLHPLAKTIVEKAVSLKVPNISANNIKEKIGVGISGEVDGKEYLISRYKTEQGIAVQLTSNNQQVAIFHFEDKVKADSLKIIKELSKKGLELMIFTGDKKENAEKVSKSLGEGIIFKAECTPEDKKIGIQDLKKEGKIVAMVGDGINDAPALAMADVGMVFSNEEHTAASEAADVVFLGGNLGSVTNSLFIAKRAVNIALQSILIGIGLSTLGMILAALGYIPPVVGAVIQEGLDIFVIINALRASR